MISPSLWRGRLPPVGQPITLAATNPTEGRTVELPGYRLLPLASGTAALGLALRIARARRPAIAEPEVLMPGYACPDLLAAACWAGVKPLLVDSGADDHALDRADLARRCTPRTIAVIAVNLLGIADDLVALRTFATQHNLLLIEDDAQWLPEPWAGTTLRGDCVILSFGRGKPVPLIGGGALLLREPLLQEPQLQEPELQEPQLQKPEQQEPELHDEGVAATLRAIGPARAERIPLPLAIAAYNCVLDRHAYGLLARLPLLALGATRYHALHEVTALGTKRAALLESNLHRHLERGREREQLLRELVVPRCPTGTIDLPTRHGARAQRLLRYPLLLPSAAQRDALYAALDAAGCGASRMYERVLPEVAGAPADVDCPPLPHARQFAARLLTLPVHQGVSQADAQRMAAIAAQFV